MVTYLTPSYVVLNGLVLSATEDSGVEWLTEKLEGWEGAPAPTGKPEQNVRGDGTWSGEQYVGGRSVAASGWVSAPTAALLEDAISRLNAACSLDDVPMHVIEQSGRARNARVHRSGEVIVQTSDLEALWSIQVYADDPRKLHDAVSATTALPQSSGGLTFPVTFPLSFDATTNHGQVTLSNPGNEVGPVTIRIDGPCAGPVIRHENSGRTLVFASSLVLGSGEFLLIDMDARTVLANGQSNRRGYVYSAGWSFFEPGDNTWSFTAASYNAASRMTVTAYPADK